MTKTKQETEQLEHEAAGQPWWVWDEIAETTTKLEDDEVDETRAEWETFEANDLWEAARSDRGHLSLMTQAATKGEAWANFLTNDEFKAWWKDKKQIVPLKYRNKYRKQGDASCCGDDISAAMKGEGDTPAKVEAIAHANGLSDKYKSYTERNKPLNNGMVRMNIGNLLRGKLKKGDDVQIGEIEFKAEDWSE